MASYNPTTTVMLNMSAYIQHECVFTLSIVENVSEVYTIRRILDSRAYKGLLMVHFERLNGSRPSALAVWFLQF